MSAIKKTILFLTASLLSTSPLAQPIVANIANQLGWVETDKNRCGGYYIEPAFVYSDELLEKNLIEISGDQAIFSLRGTSFSEGKVTITRSGQQIIANKAYLYRDPATGKLSAIDLIDHVTLRAPNDLVVAKRGRYDIKTHEKSLDDILYRTAIYGAVNTRQTHDNSALQKTRIITQLSAWGTADKFTQTEPKIYRFKKASYSTCPPTTSQWRVKASTLILNKETGRGEARNARLLLKGIPVFYTPYLNFPIDSRRQTGFLNPTFGTSGKSGPYFSAPFYWNMAPNYDMTITPSYLSKRGLQLTDMARYLTPESVGEVRVNVLPNDKMFGQFQEAEQEKFQMDSNPVNQANLRRLENASTTRTALSWQDKTRFNDHWSSNINYSYVGDDYYLQDFSSNLNEVTPNQLLQQGEATYKAQYWNFTGRIQGYQTVHPLDQSPINNEYYRLPQLMLSTNYPDEKRGLEYFVSNDLSRFDIRKMPGSDLTQPIGDRLHVQPGISMPRNWPFFYVTPRIQFAMTQYELGHIDDDTRKNPNRGLPIFDINSGLYFDRNLKLFNNHYRQTLEPQVYYTYIPFRDQSNIPIFDTTENTLTYDQLFVYNRFSGLDRIGDTNQVSLGIATRFIDQQAGIERIRAGIGQILYFQNRRVTTCYGTECINAPVNPNNTERRSPISGTLNYAVNTQWSITANTIVNGKTNKVDNQSITLHYQPDPKKMVNLGYGFVRNGDPFPDAEPDSSASNLQQTDLSVAWPVVQEWSAVARWNQNWNHHHFQNVLYGLQYDACCWAVRLVAGRAFVALRSNNTFQYNNQFYIQVALKGLTNVGSGDPSQLISSNISGYETNFGQDF